MVSSDLWTKIDANMSKVCSTTVRLPFAGLPTVIIGN